jgi:hypothetical protein
VRPHRFGFGDRCEILVADLDLMLSQSEEHRGEQLGGSDVVVDDKDPTAVIVGFLFRWLFRETPSLDGGKPHDERAPLSHAGALRGNRPAVQFD